MAEAQEGLTDAIDHVRLHDPRFPVIANSTGTAIVNSEQARHELLTGLCHCVMWKHSVRFMVDAGVNRFVEFGPARVLSSLVRRIDPDVEALTLSDPESIRKTGSDAS